MNSKILRGFPYSFASFSLCFSEIICQLPPSDTVVTRHQDVTNITDAKYSMLQAS